LYSFEQLLLIEGPGPL